MRCKLSGTLQSRFRLTGVLQARQTLSGTLTVPSRWSDLEPYEGPYEVTPEAANAVILDTNGKKMAKDVVVLKIPYYETTNESGGYTVIIG